MEGLLLFGLLVAALAVFGALALQFGADSRPDFDDARGSAQRLSA